MSCSEYIFRQAKHQLPSSALLRSVIKLFKLGRNISLPQRSSISVSRTLPPLETLKKSVVWVFYGNPKHEKICVKSMETLKKECCLGILRKSRKAHSAGNNRGAALQPSTFFKTAANHQTQLIVVKHAL